MEKHKYPIQMEIFIMEQQKILKDMVKVTSFSHVDQNMQDNLKKEKYKVLDHILINKMNNLKEFGMMEN